MTNLKKIFIFELFLITQSILLGQSIHDEPTQVDSLNIFAVKIDSLIKSGLDTFFVYRPFCESGYSGGYISPENATEKQLQNLECEYSKQSYIFYASKGSIFVTKVNECYSFSPMKLNSSPSFSYFKIHFQELTSDKVSEASVLNKDGTKSVVGTDHSCYKNFYIFMAKGKFFNLDLYDFRKKVYYGKNINYSKNKRTRIKKFSDLVSKEIEKLEFSRTDKTRK